MCRRRNTVETLAELQQGRNGKTTQDFFTVESALTVGHIRLEGTTEPTTENILFIKLLMATPASDAF